MSKKAQKAQRVIGIVLLTVLTIPVVVLCIPVTHTDIVWHESGGIPNIITSEYITTTYIPLINNLQNSRFGSLDIAFLVGYVALFGLAIWLIVHSRKRKSIETKEAK